MKIALVNHSFSLSHGGLERFSVNLALALHCSGHQVHTVGMTAADIPPEIETHTISIPRKPSWRRILGFHSKASHSVRGKGFDIVFGLTRFFPMDVYRMGDGVQKHWMRISYPFAPWRWINYLFNPAHLLNVLLERKILAANGAKRIITNSHLCRQHAQDYYGVSADRISVVYNGVDHGLFNPGTVSTLRGGIRKSLGLQDDDIAILHVSNNWRRKGLDVTLKAINQLGERGNRAHLLVVGRGRPTAFQNLVQKLGLETRVHFVGPTDKVEKYYAAGDLLVLPTLYDPFSNVCLEAMACGLPVITTSANGAAEVVGEGESGFIQKDPKSAEELADLIGRCLDPEKLRRMGKAAHRVSIGFTPQKNMEETLAVFEEIIRKKEARVPSPDVIKESD
ncbi:glycosyltransferase family 4 protein [Desulfuromonas sp. TF]|uniref:glycosyltransferase family 4 protein n=1 Tax=Desulfuromonas sp. TF TaxID=1232410 RepID=UPI000403ECD2|nr:glycosyltransferase family 4 protein [Desulfuromonas sp. TF]